MKAKVIKDTGWSKQLKELTKKALLTVGIHADDSARGEGPTNAQIGHWLELGTATTPPRPAFRNTHDEHIKEYVEMLKKVYLDAAEKKRSRAAGLKVVGEVVSNDIKSTIRARIPPPLAASTVKKKGSTVPWIDTGQVIGSIDYKVAESGL